MLFKLAYNNINLRNFTNKIRFCSTKSTPIRILVTGAAGQIGYSVLQQIAKGDCFGKDTPVEINMLDIKPVKNIMQGIKMELEDCAYDCCVKVNVFTDPENAFKGIDYGLMLANRQVLTANIKRIDLLASNRDLYIEMGEHFSKYANPNAKILMVANPANTNCLVMLQNSKNRDPLSFSSLSRLDHNRLGRILADRLGVVVSKVTKYMVWGNHASSMHPDIRLAEFFKDNNPFTQPELVHSILTKNEWNEKCYVTKIKERAFEVIRARQKSSALSAASAAIDHIHDWHNGTKDGTWVSMGVYSDGKNYNIPSGIVYSMPCVCYDGKYVIIDDLPIDPETKECLQFTANDLLEEKKLAGI